MTEKQSPASAARKARLLGRASISGALATVRKGKDKGQPYVSKVGVSLDMDGTPLFLLSTLAAHTQDVLTDPRASLLLEASSSDENPLQGARATLVGSLEQLPLGQDERERERYLASHPSAAQYASFGDFSLWHMRVEKVHYVGGFGLAKWAKSDDYLAPILNLGKQEAKLLDRLNGDYKTKLRLLASQTTGGSSRGWTAVALDSDGMALVNPKGQKTRLNFKSPAPNLRGWRDRFSRLISN